MMPPQRCRNLLTPLLLRRATMVRKAPQDLLDSKALLASLELLDLRAPLVNQVQLVTKALRATLVLLVSPVRLVRQVTVLIWLLLRMVLWDRNKNGWRVYRAHRVHLVAGRV